MRQDLERRLSAHMDEIELNEDIATALFTRIDEFEDQDIKNMLYWDIDDFVTWFDLW